jgi:FHA domain/Double zinc ribbon
MIPFPAARPEDDMASLTCPGCSAPVQQEDLICFTCGTNLPRPRPAEEVATPPTVMQEYRPDLARAARALVTCPNCGSALTDRSARACAVCRTPLPHPAGPIAPVVLQLSFPTGNVDVPAGTSLVLGRDPEISLVAAAFADHENVSRRHATVTVTDAGEATIRDEHSTNGTFVNGDRVVPGTEVRLADGDSVRLAADVTAGVSLPANELNPAPFSTNGHGSPH